MCLGYVASVLLNGTRRRREVPSGDNIILMELSGGASLPRQNQPGGACLQPGLFFEDTNLGVSDNSYCPKSLHGLKLGK